MKPQLVFVYGTLKQGYGNNYILRTSRLLGAAETIGKMRMYDAGFPVVRPRTEKPGDWNATVTGEVYLVTDPDVMRRLDQLESEGRMYHRRKKKVRMTATTKVVHAHTYIGDTKFWMHRVKLWPLAGDRYVWSRP